MTEERGGVPAGHQSILRKLLLGLACVLLFLPAFLALRATLERRLVSDERVVGTRYPLSRRAHDLGVASLEMSLTALTRSATADADPSLLRTMEAGRTAFRTSRDELRRLLPEETPHDATEIDRLCLDLERLVDRVADLQRAGAPEGDLAAERALLLASQRRLADLLDRGLQAQIGTELDQRRAVLSRHLAASLALDGVAVSSLLVIGVVLGLAVYRDAGRTTTTVLEGIDAIVQTGLTHRMDESPPDDLGLLARHINRMAASLQESTVPRARLKQSELQLEATKARLQAALAEERRLRAAG